MIEDEKTAVSILQEHACARIKNLVYSSGEPVAIEYDIENFSDYPGIIWTRIRDATTNNIIDGSEWVGKMESKEEVHISVTISNAPQKIKIEVGHIP